MSAILEKRKMDLLKKKKESSLFPGEARTSFSVFWPVPSGMTSLGERRRDWVQLWCFVVKGILAFATDEKDGAWVSSPPLVYLCHVVLVLYACWLKGGWGILYSLRMSVCEWGGIHILNFKSLQFLFPRKKEVRMLHFMKLTEVLSTDAAQEI